MKRMPAAEAPSARGRPPLRLVAQPAPRRRIAFFVLSVAMVGAIVVALVITQVLVSQNAFRLDELSRRAAELEQKHARLELEVAKLSSPKRIETEARRLGLELPEDVEIVYVGDRG